MMSRARSISRIHRESPARTASTPSTRSTVVALASEGPTASCQTNRVLAGDPGCRRMISASTDVEKVWSGCTCSYIKTIIRQMRLILASSSPRRAELLAAAGYAFEVSPPNVDESSLPDEDPREYVVRVARTKAEHVGAGDPGTIVLSADTVVVARGRVMGKPTDAAEAESMLRMLSGAVHHVHTGVCLRSAGETKSEVVTTRVS